nr:MAG TPA: hypothetical protein [Caudoviricetes sp.]
MTIFYEDGVVLEKVVNFTTFHNPTLYTGNLIVVDPPKGAFQFIDENKYHYYLAFTCEPSTVGEALVDKCFLVRSRSVPTKKDFFELSAILEAGIVPKNLALAQLSDKEMDDLYEGLANPDWSYKWQE